MMPLLFVGHGSPMNAIETNEYTKGWQKIAAAIPKPNAILVISAHWVTDGTRICTAQNPKTIYDFCGFPKALYQARYDAPGAPALAEKTMGILGGRVIEDNTWGIDHGAWSVLRVMYPKADIPVCQLSLDKRLDTTSMFDLGKRLKPLREENILILGSGNVVHNLMLTNFSVEGGYDWADEFDEYIRANIEKQTFENVMTYKNAGECAKNAFFTREHFDPLLYVLGAVDEADSLTVYNNARMAGSLSMTSYLFA